MNTWQEALKLIPKGTQTASKSFVHMPGIEPFFIEKSKGAYFWTKDKKKFLDFCCALGPIILGNKNKKVNKAVKEQLKKGVLFSAPIELELNLAKQINKIIPNAEMIRFAKNGSDSVLACVRIALAYTKKRHIASFGYHGFNDFSATLMMPNGIPYWKEYVKEFKYNDINSLEYILKTYDCACILIEPISLEEPKNDYLQKVRHLANKYGALLIFDEVVSGFRYNLKGIQSLYNVNADLICLGKAMANGFPISALCGKEKYMKMLEKEVMFSLTFGADAVSLAAALATIKELKTKDYQQIKKLGEKFKNDVEFLISKYKIGAELKGNPFRMYLNFKQSGIKSIFNKKLFKGGVFMPNVIYMNFSHKEEDINFALWEIEKAFKYISQNANSILPQEEISYIQRKQ